MFRVEVYDTKRNDILVGVDHDCPSGNAAALETRLKESESCRLVHTWSILLVSEITLLFALRGTFKIIFSH